MGLPKQLRWGISSAILLHTAYAEPSKIVAPEGSDTLKGVPYTKHDPKRPQPPKVSGAYQNTKAPSDAIILFDGKNLDAFQKSSPANKVSKGGHLILGPGGLISQKPFSDCQLHLEWRIPEGREIKGQKGSNSGILMMGLFEIQILESFNNLTYADGHAGAMYGERPPLKNSSLPQGQWQSFDIYFKAPKYENKKMIEPAKLTLIHNGVLVHLDQSFEQLSSYRKHKPYPNYPIQEGPIQIKWDGDIVDFKNIWVRPLGTYDSLEKPTSKTAQHSAIKSDQAKTSKTN